MQIVRGEPYRNGIILERNDKKQLDYAVWDFEFEEMHLDGRFTIAELKAILTFVEGDS